MSDLFQWKDGREFFQTNTSTLRKLLQGLVDSIPMVVVRWANELRGVPRGLSVWNLVWKIFWEEKVNHFLWQIIHRISPMLHYVGHRTTRRDGAGVIIPFHRDDLEWMCPRCNGGYHEDLPHCLWSCVESMEIQEWIRQIMEAASRGVYQLRFGFDAGHALIGTPLNTPRDTPLYLWHILRGITLWNVWKSCCTLEREGTQFPREVVQRRIWMDV